MQLLVPTAPAQVRAAITAALVLDPVANTIFGSILEDPGDQVWCAVHPDRPGVVAARSAAAFPVVLTPGWTRDDASALAVVINSLPELNALSGDVEVASAVADGVAARTGRVIRDRRPERLFRLDELAEPVDVAGSSRVGERGDRDLLSGWITAFSNEVHAPLADPRSVVDRLVDPHRPLARLWINPAGRPVALAGRRPAAYGSARVGPVFTPQEERGHGYGAAVTAVATREILDQGAVPVLFTDAAQPVPNRMYQRLGYRPVRELVRVLFDPTSAS